MKDKYWPHPPRDRKLYEPSSSEQAEGVVWVDKRGGKYGDFTLAEYVAAQRDGYPLPPEDEESYAPDDDAFEALVDAGENRPDPKPHPDALDPTDAIAAMARAVETLETWVVDGTGSPEDKQRLYVTMLDTIKAFYAVKQVVIERVLADTYDPFEVEGRWFRPDMARTITGWDRDALNAKASELFLRDKVDKESGEMVPPTPQEVVERVWKLCKVAESRTAALRNVGIAADDYAKVETKPTIVEERSV